MVIMMKARIKSLNQLVDEEVQKQVKQARNEIYDDVCEDIVRQTIACCLFYLDKTYGFRKKRLSEVVQGIVSIMQLKPFGKTIDAVQVMNYLQDQYDINLDELKVISNENNNS